MAAPPGPNPPAAPDPMREEVRLVSSYPLPPMQYISKYSDDTVQRGLAPNPPPPPAGPGCSYGMFGMSCNQEDQILQSLESQNVRRVYPAQYDHRRELEKLNFSVLANFLDLLDLMTRDRNSPKRQDKLDDLNTLFINMHHLVNEYRPQQARDVLREILQHQCKVTEQTIQVAERYLAKAEVCLDQGHKEIGQPEDLRTGFGELLAQIGLSEAELTTAAESMDDGLARGKTVEESSELSKSDLRLWDKIMCESNEPMDER